MASYTLIWIIVLWIRRSLFQSQLFTRVGLQINFIFYSKAFGDF